MFSVPDKSAAIRDYIELYLFADKYLIEELQNDAIDVVYDYYIVHDKFPKPLDVELVFQNTLEENAMRRLVTYRWASMTFSQGSDDLWSRREIRQVMMRNPEIGYELIATIASVPWITHVFCHRNPRRPMISPDKCSLHLHEKTPRC